MKNLLNLIIVTVIAGFVLSSCGKQMTITKRKYTKGYYVSHSHKRNDAKAPSAVASSKRDATENLQPAILKTEPVLSIQNQIQEPTLTASAIKPADNFRQVNSANTALHPNVSTKKFYQVKNLDQLVPSSKHFTKEFKKMATDQDALSLLWIIIVVLLILYLIGLIAGGWGLGWAIHVLAVVALVLLILWLLRIL